MGRGCWVIVILLISCTSSKHYSPGRKYSNVELKEDYKLLKSALEQKHPSLYWYTPKDSMDMYFKLYEDAIIDSMTEQQFNWKVLAPLINKIHCGHTSVNMSKGYQKWVKNRKLPSFPLYLKVWNDTMAVTASLKRNDSVFRRGTIVHSINGLNVKQLTSIIFDYLPEDGYADNISYIRLSSSFPYFHRNIFGLSPIYKVSYSDSTGKIKQADLPIYKPPADSVVKDSVKVKLPKVKIPRKTKLVSYRSLVVDSAGYAIMTLNTFTKGYLRKFFRQSFRELKKEHINHLALDIRLNGGGKIGLSTLLTRYVSRKSFRIADSVYARSKTLYPFTHYFKGKIFNNLQLAITTKRKSDGLFHQQHLERKVFSPKKKFHYDGKLYVIISGPTFSAASLFSSSVKGQEGISLVGEETGGGWHGNDGVMIPEFTLPNTRLRITFPLFRLVQYNHVPKTGSGVIPDIYIGTSYDALLKGYDKKIKSVKEMMIQDIKK